MRGPKGFFREGILYSAVLDVASVAYIATHEDQSFLYRRLCLSLKGMELYRHSIRYLVLIVRHKVDTSSADGSMSYGLVWNR
jgi:hypothetical protein